MTFTYNRLGRLATVADAAGTRTFAYDDGFQLTTETFAAGGLFDGMIITRNYEDGSGKYLPKPSKDADVSLWLPENIAQEKYKIITELYGHVADSFEAKACPKREAFWTLGVK